MANLPVLQTRCIGMRPHFSGHVLAPPEYVFECQEPSLTDQIGYWARFAARITLGVTWMVTLPIGCIIFLLVQAGVLPR